ncbi:MAG TPA: asparagine synthase-related protein [Phycisphaerae bacterium]|nr:asparagine synthetase B [Phycisphaerales bacterium]HRX84915.1 asparagine synthase-related protein [Phycisphaerae bacterium]
MCGIVGIIGPPDAEIAHEMLRRISHRGTDDRQWRPFDRFGGLGFNRLSIIDLERGDQPLFNEDGSLALVCNGEVYNHAAIRRDLRSDHTFATGSDAEVILHLYEEYGDDAVKFLDGMFAFILLDLRRGRVIFGRDPLGIKPLWYRGDGDATYVASEVKALIGRGDEGIRELPPGSIWTSDEGVKRYWEPSLATTEPDFDVCRALLTGAVRKRMMSDVGVGTFLSGGIDSSLVTALAARENPNIVAYTVGMEGAPDVAMARRVAEYLGIEHVVQTFTIDDMLALLPDAIYHIESYNPSMVTGAVVTYMCSRLAADHGAKVVLCGEGADELFGGYSAVRALTFLDLRRKLEELLGALHKTELRRLDRLSMATTLEARVPFLDREFVEYAFNLPSDEKIKQVDGRRVEKWHLRKAFEGYLPDELIWREKCPFDQGSGARSLIPLIESEVDDETFERKRREYAPWNIQSKEMLRYFEIWRGHFSDLLEPGRTFDLFGDYPVLMDQIAARGQGAEAPVESRA